jgi:hypothetical protein
VQARSRAFARRCVRGPRVAIMKKLIALAIVAFALVAGSAAVMAVYPQLVKAQGGMAGGGG